MSLFRLGILLCLVPLGYNFLPGPPANLEFVHGVAALEIFRKLESGPLIRAINVYRGERSDEAVAESHAVQVEATVVQGYRVTQETKSDFRIQTRSLCLEVRPACLQIKSKSISQYVTVKLVL